jgi:hypothetical protein
MPIVSNSIGLWSESLSMVFKLTCKESSANKNGLYICSKLQPLEGIVLELLCFSVFTLRIRMQKKVKKNDLTGKRPATS